MTKETHIDSELEYEGEWEILKINTNYEILNQHPYPIRKICNHGDKCKKKMCHKHISECWSNGYLNVALNGQRLGKHRVIALQWITNDDPENKTHVDHINRIKSDNRLENLRWTTQSDNSKNSKRKDSEYLQEIPETAMRIEEYNNIELNRYWYDPIDEKLYMKTTMEDYHWKVIKPYWNAKVLQFNLTDVDGKQRSCNWFKFVQEMSEIM